MKYTLLAAASLIVFGANAEAQAPPMFAPQTDFEKSFTLFAQSNAESCVIRHRGSSDALDACDIPKGAEIGALYFIMHHWVDDPWGQENCVPRVPTGYKCTFRGYTYSTSGFRQN